MVNSKNKKNDSYKNYKYVYTGYKDYCKEHNIKTTNTTNTQKQQNINHDHRFAFDFNNPNQHTHDYSFDFSQEEPKVEKKRYTSTINDAKKYTQTSYSKPTNSSSYPKTRTTSTTTYQRTAPTNINKDAFKKVKNTIILIFVFIFIVNIIVAVATLYSEYESDYIYDHEYSYDDEYYYEDTYKDAIDDYCKAIEYLDYSYLEDRITDEEKYYNNGYYWQTDINNIKTRINTTNVYSFEYEYLSTTQKTDYSLNTLENNFNSRYSSDVTINEAYTVVLKLNINNMTTYKYVTVGEIDNTWYLISVS